MKSQFLNSSTPTTNTGTITSITTLLKTVSSPPTIQYDKVQNNFSLLFFFLSLCVFLYF